jgi:hypothetical protein
MPKDVGRGKRFEEARYATAARRKEGVSQGGMAALLAKLVRRKVHQPQISAWEAGAEPPLDVIRAYEVLSGLSRDYLAWGPVDSPVGESSHSRGAAIAEAPTADEVARQSVGTPASRKRRPA